MNSCQPFFTYLYVVYIKLLTSLLNFVEISFRCPSCLFALTGGGVGNFKFPTKGIYNYGFLSIHTGIEDLYILYHYLTNMFPDETDIISNLSPLPIEAGRENKVSPFHSSFFVSLLLSTHSTSRMNFPDFRSFFTCLDLESISLCILFSKR